MEYLLVMSFSGTTVVCLYILLRHIIKSSIPAVLQYLLLKISILYYLIPLPFLKSWYRNFWVNVCGLRERIGIDIFGHMSYRIAYIDNSMYINNYMKIQMIILTVWILISCCLFMMELYNYFKKKKFVISCIKNINAEPEVIEVERGIGACRLTQKVIVYYALYNRKNMAFGLFRPIILCGATTKSTEAEIILNHEITHIKRLDVFWKILLRLAVILHWWNPAVWFLYRDFEGVCECSCDDIVLHGKTKEEIKAYMLLLVNESKKNGKEEVGFRRLGMNLKGEMTRLSERIENAMNMKKWNKAAVLLVAVLVMTVNSLTVFAYPKINTVSGEWSDDELEGFIRADTAMFVTKDASEEELQNTIYETKIFEVKYEKQFIDTDGNIYQVKDDIEASVYGSCSHTYVSGTYTEHIKDSYGGCTVVYYNARKCSKCGYMKIGDKLHTVVYDTCLH